MKRLFLDIESSALSVDELDPIIPEFEPDKRLKDVEKIALDLQSKKLSWLDGAALKPTTGKVIAVSFCKDDLDPVFMAHAAEPTLLDILQDHIKEAISGGGSIYGWNLFGFDLPFFCARCAVHGIPAFKSFTTCYRGRWSWKENFIDAMQIWCGPYQRSDGASLKAVAYSLGLGLKTGNGKDFSELLKSDPESAKQYALMDVKLLRGIVEKMGI